METVGDVAIVGMALRSANTPDVPTFWADVKAGRCRLEPAPERDARPDGHWVRAKTMLTDAGCFDREFFGLDADSARWMDPQHRVFLETCWAATEDAGIALGQGPRSIGVFSSAQFSSYFSLGPEDRFLESMPGVLGSDKDQLSCRVAHHLDFTGPTVAVQSACSSSLVAIHLACAALREGDCDAALVGGVAIGLPHREDYYFAPGGPLSPDGLCRAFDVGAQGMVFSEGSAAVVLKLLDVAVRDHDRIYAVIAGSAINNDGANRAGYTAPSSAGQASVVERAMKRAGVRPSQVRHIECHGAGTPIGDALELRALQRLMAADGAAPGTCLIGSAKANLGHMANAAGVVSLIKAALSVQQNCIPPVASFSAPCRELIAGDSVCRAPVAASSWPADGPRWAGVSAFGMGGANAHVVLREAPDRPASSSRRRRHLFPVSAKTDGALRRLSEQLVTAARTGEACDIAYTLAIGRAALPVRALINLDDAVAGIESGSGAGRTSPLVVTFPDPSDADLRTAPALDCAEPGFARGIRAAADALDQVAGDACGAMTAHRLLAGLRLTTVTERREAGFIFQVGLWSILQAWSVSVSAVQGQRDGTYAAAWAGGALDLVSAAEAVVAAKRPSVHAPTPSDLNLGLGSGPSSAGVLWLCPVGDAPADLCVQQVMGELWRLGHKVNLAAAYEGEVRRICSLPTYPFERMSCGVDSITTAWAAPGRKAQESTAENIASAAGDPLEAKLCDIWADVLGTKVGPQDDFFELGGSSMAAAQIAAEAEAAFGVELPLVELFEESTVAKLAVLIRAQRGAASLAAE